MATSDRNEGWERGIDLHHRVTITRRASAICSWGGAVPRARQAHMHWPVVVLHVVSAGHAALLVQPHRAAVVPLAGKHRRLAPQAVLAVHEQLGVIVVGPLQVLPVEQVIVALQFWQVPSVPQR
jgi:hypothetical protein